MDEDFLDVTENSKKVWIFFIFIVVLIVILGYFLIFRKFNFGAKTVQLEYGSTLSENVEDYLTKKVVNPKDYKLNTSNVNPNEIGSYTYTITYNNITKKGTVNVEDTTPPDFTLQEFIVEEGSETYYLGDFLATCEDVSKPCLVSLKNEKDESLFNKVGTHTIDIVVTDLYGNKKEGQATLKVVEKGSYVNPKTTDLEIASNSREDSSFKGTVYKKLEKALEPNSDAADDVMSEISAIDLEQYIITNYAGYRLVSSEIIELYNKSSYVVGYSIEATISNGTEKVIYIEESKVPSNETTDQTSEE